ncbi:glycosyl hydrolase 115 family protein [Marinoscillum furvescens]|uniref:glycosyl hydrolase 115 family protein n=1 Tax=Marinoscillum furvescens TaxID=1026 RepID=UPI0014753FDB|nr:glycosyl hydrolase 115 family protein [Marinoscillum furvescens]
MLPQEEGYFVYLSPDSDSLIWWAAEDLAQDIAAITNTAAQVAVAEALLADLPGIYVGNFSDSDITTKSCWECFEIDYVKGSLIVTGGDVRGTVYGIFDLAEQLGISPWKWWADVPLPKSATLDFQIPVDGYREQPAVQYRGIFLNDEDWGLQPWAAKTLETEVGDIGPKTYEKIFQLLLRLKANTIWPAMHPSTKAFYTISGNKEMAAQYHIYVGTSHAEPMLRNNVDEWSKKEMGEYNYAANASRIDAYWQERIEELDEQDKFLVTIGMRGIHDSGMTGASTIEDRVSLLEKIINSQRNILEQSLDAPADRIPQMFIPYKEVLYLFNNGLQVPEDVTLVWPDDNYGYIRRLSDKTEQLRPGGSGVYYHLSYWGRPHDYLWLSTTQPGLIWYEMKRAYANGARKIWIANVGDIKPAEYNMEFFLDLAWDIDEVNPKNHLTAWASREFGTQHSEEIAAIMSEYYRLAMLRKPEYMGWSQTEPTTQIKQTAFLDTPYGELTRRVTNYQALYDRVEKVSKLLNSNQQAAFFQLVAYPVKCATRINHKFLYNQQALMADTHEKKLEFDRLALEAYQEIVRLTNQYNREVNDGKWNHMMDLSPRNLPVYQAPPFEYSISQVPSAKPETTPLFLKGSDYAKAKGQQGFEWQSIEGLGYTCSAVTLAPFVNEHFESLPELTYELEIDQPGEYHLEVRCLPTHANDGNHQLSISVNGAALTTHNLNTKGRSEAWKQNVLRNYQAIQVKVKLNKGMNKLTLSVNQTGIVIDQLAVIPVSMPLPYEIPVKK